MEYQNGQLNNNCSLSNGKSGTNHPNMENDLIDINKSPEDSPVEENEPDESKQSSDAEIDAASPGPSNTSDDEDDSEDEDKPKKKPKKLSKEEQLELLTLAGAIRRSDRRSVTVQRYNPGVQSTDSDSPQRKRTRTTRKSPTASNPSDEDSSGSSGGFDGKKRRNPAPKKPVRRSKPKVKRHDYSSDNTDDSFEQAQRMARRGAKVNYKEKSSDTDVNEDDVLEWGDEDSHINNDVTDLMDTIEKILKNRKGVKGATGSQTTIYNCEDKGDPNADVEETSDPLEQQYLIKWVGWAHIHNTWESEDSLLILNAKGTKKLDNHKQRMWDIDAWKRTVDRETIEYFDCEQEMNEQLFQQYTKVERVVAHNKVREKEDTESIDYLVKWAGLPYSEATWEDSSLIARWFQDKIDEYNVRSESQKLPNKSCPALKRRPKFTELAEQPEYLAGGCEGMILRDYQLKGLNWLLYSWCKTNSVILADEMGLGKTIQVISFFDALVNRYDVYGPYLMVVPLSTMAAWQKEFQLWAPDLNVIVYLGDVSSREMIRQFEWLVPGTKRLRFNCILTTFEILLKDKSFLGSVDWVVVGVDEAHRLKNHESLLYKALSDFNTDHRLLVTGTPLQNSLKELWALLHFIMPHKYESWEEFEEIHQKQEKKGYSNLHEELKPLLLRRVKKQVEKSLPAKVEKILRVDMTATQKQYYKWILTKNYKALSKGVKGSITGFINLVMELKKCCNHTYLTRAPDIEPKSGKERLEQLVKGSGKLILLDKLLMRLKDTGHRVLIFSQMVMLLDILQEYLRLRRFTYQRLDGSIRGDLRKQALDHFNAPNSTDFCFLLSTRAGGLGINLATADTVIIFDSDWNPQNDLQAQSRAHRIGQKRQVNIYRLVTKSSVEEDIIERAKRKLVLDHLVIQRMDTAGRTVLSKNAVSSSTNGVPFDKSELSSILKFGAQDLFKEKDGDEQDPEVDIDDVLQGAETTETDETHAADFLNVEVTNFAFDEEEEIDYWQKVIPEDQRKKVDDEERAQQEASLFLPPRARNKVQMMARNEDSDDEWRKKKSKKGEDDSENSDSTDDDRARKNKKDKRDQLFSFNDNEIRRFVKSFRKFAKPLSRLEAIACDALLEEHSDAELRQLAEALIKGCQQAANEYEHNNDEEEAKKRDRGIDVYVKPLVTVQASLEPLNSVMPEKTEERATFKLPGKPKLLKTWDVQWDESDDAFLLRGVYEYGMGSWDSIKMDPQLGLTEKILLNDKNKKPQAKHLHTRVDYLLKYLHKLAEVGGIKSKKKGTANNNLSMDTANNHDIPEPSKKRGTAKSVDRGDKLGKLIDRKRGRPPKTKVEESVDDNHLPVNKNTKINKKKTTKQLVINPKLGEDLKDNTSAMFKECVREMRSVKKAIRKVSESVSKDEIQHQLLKIGDHINSVISAKGKTSKLTEKWHSCLWIFVSRFIENGEPSALAKDYLSAVRDKDLQHELDANNHKHHHSHNSHNSHHHSHHHKKPITKPLDTTKANEPHKPPKISSPGWNHSNYDEPRYSVKRPEDSYNQVPIKWSEDSSHNSSHNQVPGSSRPHFDSSSRDSRDPRERESRDHRDARRPSPDLNRGSWRPVPSAPSLQGPQNRVSSRDPRHRT